MLVAQLLVAAIVVALIIKYGFGAAIIVLGVLAAFYVIVALAMPIFVHAKLRVTATPTVQPVTLDDASIPEPVRAELIAHRDALVSLGFLARDVIHQAPVFAPAGYLALYVHPTTSARALSRVLLKPGKGSVVYSSDLEFEMRYENGTSAELSNVSTAVPGLELIPGAIHQMPDVRDTSRLHDYFLKVVTKYEREAGVTEHARVPLPAQATLTSVYLDQLQRSYAIQHRGGFVQPTSTPGIWRPTWRMTLLIAVSTISPGLEFMKRRLSARGDRLRRELDGDTTRTLAERLGSRRGWIMFVVGLALTALAVLMTPPASSVAFVGIMIAWWLAKRRKKEPGWRAILVGGSAAILLLGVPMGIPFSYPGLPLGTADAVALLGLFLLPMVLLTGGTALVVEGFRAAAGGR